jgi:predicted DNA-binding ribbon-helix-helix protein
MGGDGAMQSSCIKSHSISIAGHKTSISLEDDFWNSLRNIAREHREALSDLISKIDAERNCKNLSSAIRLFVLRHYRDQPDQQSEMVTPLVPYSIEVYRGQ